MNSQENAEIYKCVICNKKWPGTPYLAPGAYPVGPCCVFNEKVMKERSEQLDISLREYVEELMRMNPNMSELMKKVKWPLGMRYKTKQHTSSTNSF